MKQTWKHRIWASALTLTLLAGVLSVPAQAASAGSLPADQANAYQEIMNSSYGRMGSGTLIHAELLDFNGDGVQELYLAYTTMDGGFAVSQEVWSWANGRVLDTKAPLEVVVGKLCSASFVAKPTPYLCVTNDSYASGGAGSTQKTAYYYRGGTKWDTFQCRTETTIVGDPYADIIEGHTFSYALEKNFTVIDSGKGNTEQYLDGKTTAFEAQYFPGGGGVTLFEVNYGTDFPTQEEPWALAGELGHVEVQERKQRCLSYKLPKVKAQWTAAEVKQLETLLNYASRQMFPALQYDCKDPQSTVVAMFFAGKYVEPLNANYDDPNAHQITYSLDALQTWLRQNLGIEPGLTNETKKTYSIDMGNGDWESIWKIAVQNGRATFTCIDIGAGAPSVRCDVREIYDLGSQTYLVYFGTETSMVEFTGKEAEIRPSTAILRKVGGKLSLLRFDGTDAIIPGTEADLRKYGAPLAYSSQSDIYVDGKKISFDAYALRDEAGNATNYLKLRDVALALNGSAAQFNVGWENGAITLTTGAPYTTANGSEMKKPFSGDQPYAISANRILVNGRAVELGAILLTAADGSGHTYVKLRDLGLALGFAVNWDAATGTVQIGTD